jgi:hypothetical protein
MAYKLTDLAVQCRSIIEAAELDEVEVDDGNVVDLCADNTDGSLSDIRDALVVAGYGERFVRATSGNHDDYFNKSRHIQTK